MRYFLGGLLSTAALAWGGFSVGSGNASALGGISPSAYTLTLLDDSSASAWRSTLGLADDAIAEQWTVLASDESETSNTVLKQSALKFTPEASKTYFVRVICSFTTAINTTGIRASITDSNSSADGSGASWYTTRGTGSTTETSVWLSNVSGVNPSTGTWTAGQDAGTGETMVHLESVWTADASPTDVGLFFMSEVNGSAVTAKGGKCALSRLQLN